MSECTHDCSTCGQNCASRGKPQDLHEAPHKLSHIKKVIGVVSGKGGVGKSMTSAMMAVTMRRLGYKCGVLDADITGPSIPKLFGIHARAVGDDKGIWPIKSRTGIDIMSINLLLENEDDPVVWRGPVIAGAVKQFWQDVIWEDVDFLFVDMPPGTGDVPLTVFQTLPVDGILVVTSPQELVSMIVAKAVKMAQMMNVPILGVVENMSYVLCPDCGRHIQVFGDSHVDEIAEKYSLPVLAKMPIDPALAKNADEGLIETFAGDEQCSAESGCPAEVNRNRRCTCHEKISGRVQSLCHARQCTGHGRRRCHRQCVHCYREQFGCRHHHSPALSADPRHQPGRPLHHSGSGGRRRQIGLRKFFAEHSLLHHHCLCGVCHGESHQQALSSAQGRGS